jgi:hypothetical protein
VFSLRSSIHDFASLFSGAQTVNYSWSLKTGHIFNLSEKHKKAQDSLPKSIAVSAQGAGGDKDLGDQ